MNGLSLVSIERILLHRRGSLCFYRSMKIPQAIADSDKPLISIEILPPERGSNVGDLFYAIESLLPFQVSFINVTKHQSSYSYEELQGQIHKKPENRKPGTVAVSAAIAQRYGIDTVPHLICGGNTKYSLEDMLIDLQYLGIQNLFVVRGDPAPGQKKFMAEPEGFSYALDMVRQIQDMNEGKYVYDVKEPSKTDFCIGVAGYPEKHYEALNLEKDLIRLKEKVDAGAEYIITQMFFSASVYKEFVTKARALGIDVPIIPGLKPLVRKQTLLSLPRTFFIDIPQNFLSAMEDARSRDEEWDVGTKYMKSLIEELIDFGIPGIHLFTMGKGTSSRRLLEALYG
jgi:methylenetetrahydrofolate reductase (NADPH)